MILGLFLRVSWVCLLLGIGTCLLTALGSVDATDAVKGNASGSILAGSNYGDPNVTSSLVGSSLSKSEFEVSRGGNKSASVPGANSTSAIHEPKGTDVTSNLSSSSPDAAPRGFFFGFHIDKGKKTPELQQESLQDSNTGGSGQAPSSPWHETPFLYESTYTGAGSSPYLYGGGSLHYGHNGYSSHGSHDPTHHHGYHSGSASQYDQDGHSSPFHKPYGGNGGHHGGHGSHLHKSYSDPISSLHQHKQSSPLHHGGHGSPPHGGYHGGHGSPPHGGYHGGHGSPPHGGYHGGHGSPPHGGYHGGHGSPPHGGYHGGHGSPPHGYDDHHRGHGSPPPGYDDHHRGHGSHLHIGYSDPSSPPHQHKQGSHPHHGHHSSLGSPPPHHHLGLPHHHGGHGSPPHGGHGFLHHSSTFAHSLSHQHDFDPELLHLSSMRVPFIQAWNNDHVPLSMVKTPVQPLSLVIQSHSSYQRARELHSDAKYTQDTFNDVPIREMDPQQTEVPETGFEGQKKVY